MIVPPYLGPLVGKTAYTVRPRVGFANASRDSGLLQTVSSKQSGMRCVPIAELRAGCIRSSPTSAFVREIIPEPLASTPYLLTPPLQQTTPPFDRLIYDGKVVHVPTSKMRPLDVPLDYS